MCASPAWQHLYASQSSAIIPYSASRLDERVGPYASHELFLGEQLARPLQQRDQYFEGAAADVNRLVSAIKPLGTWTPCMPTKVKKADRKPLREGAETLEPTYTARLTECQVVIERWLFHSLSGDWRDWLGGG